MPATRPSWRNGWRAPPASRCWTTPACRQALKPGGLLFIETFVRTEPEMQDASYYLEPGELSARFSDYELILDEEAGLPPRRSRPARGVARLGVRKPGVPTNR